MADVTSTTLLETVFSNIPPGELRSYVARSAAYWGDSNLAKIGNTQHLRTLDPLPLILSHDDIRLLHEVADQWGMLLEEAYRDLRGAQTLLARGAVSAETLWSTVGIDPAFHGLPVANRAPLGLIRLDVVKDRTNGWRIIAASSGVPSGLGFALESRVIHSRVYSSMLNRSRVLRLAPFFQRLRQHWVSAALHHRDEPSVMIWTPGPTESTHPEHVYLRRYFGFPLVESRDLTVGSGKVYLKMLGGLKAVDVLVRMVGDRQVDPLAGNPPPTDGVAGLVQSIRDGEVFVTNMPGSDFLSHPDLLAQLADAAGDLIGSELAVPFDAAPRNPEVEPFWNGESWEDTPYALSLFLSRSAQSWELMPGGVARPLPGQLAGSNPLSVASKDIWFLSSSSVKFFSLLPRRDAPSPVSRTSDLPSRVADDLYWLGRYSERAWVDLRFLGKWVDMSNGEHDDSFQERLEMVRSCIVSMEIGSPEESVDGTRWRLWDTLRNIEQVALRVRDRFSLETHWVFGRLAAEVSHHDAGARSLRDSVNQASLYLAAFNGLANEHMTRGPAWRFLDMGKRLERAVLLCEAVEVFCSRRADSDDLTLLLELFDSMITYRNRYYFVPELGPVLDLLMLDESNPRSLAFQVAQIGEHLEKLPHQPEEAYRSDGEQHILRLLTSIRLAEGPKLAGDASRRYSTALQGFLSSVLADLAAVSDAVNRRYLVKLEALQRMQSLNLSDHS